MSVLTPDQAPEDLATPVEPAIADAGTTKPAGPHDVARDDEAQVNPGTTSLAVFLAVAGAGWMAGGIFSGGLFPRLVGVGGAAIGTALVFLSYRSRRPGTIQSLGVPVAAVTGALLVLPFTGGNTSLPNLVREAISAGGAASPPVPFDPGWRFILVFIMTVLGTGAASIAISLRRPQIGIFIPVPLILLASLAQAPGTPVVLTAVAVALIPAAFSVAHGAELARDGATSGRFELRRLSRSAGVLVAMIAVLYLLSLIGLLPSEDEQDQVVPPQRPPPSEAQPDRELFRVTSERPLTWRLGVLDVYDGQGWLLPPYDTKSFRSIPKNGSITDALDDKPAVGYAGAAPPPPPPALPLARETVKVSVEVTGLTGRVLPTILNTGRVQGAPKAKYDPRTQVLRLTDGRASEGLRYEIEAPLPPTASALEKAEPPPPSVEQFLEVPPSPPAVTALLTSAPAGPLFDRLQFIRNAYFQKVVAAGEGTVTDVPPEKVAAMVEGGEATPYEITAGEVLLARWAGVPARIGYGFYAGDQEEGSNVFSVRPRHGATWLEAYFEGHGWVPILGRPAKAKASLNNDNKQLKPDIQASDDLALTAYLPVRLTSIRLLFEIIRYWLVRAFGVGVLLALFWTLFPGVVKMARRWRRQRWARERGPLERIVVAYAEFRDVANDLNVGDTVLTPIEFVTRIEPDTEHQELAWLTSRALWGDLQRDLTVADAEIAEDAARSVTKRLRKMQAPITRMLGFGGRVSLRSPYTDEVPNLWPRWAVGGIVRRTLGRGVAVPGRLLRSAARTVARTVRRPAPTTGLLLVLLALSPFLGACGSGDGQTVREGSVLPKILVPAEAGGVRFRREPAVEESYNEARPESLVDEGRIFTLRRDIDLIGGLQVAAFKPGLIKSETDAREVREGVLAGLGNGKFAPKRLGSDLQVWEQVQREQKLYVWFAPDMAYFELLIAKQGFEDAANVFGAVLAFQQSKEFTVTKADRGSTLLDPRRGGLD